MGGYNFDGLFVEEVFWGLSVFQAAVDKEPGFVFLHIVDV